MRTGITFVSVVARSYKFDSNLHYIFFHIFFLYTNNWQLMFTFAEVLLQELLHRMPQLANAEIRQMINGPESFTPDSRYLLGEVPEV